MGFVLTAVIPLGFFERAEGLGVSHGERILCINPSLLRDLPKVIVMLIGDQKPLPRPADL